MWKKFLAALVMFCAAAMAMAAVDVNKATQAELDGLKGIGPATSKAIMAERKKGDFKSWDDFISRVKGIGEKNAAKFSSEGLTVNGEAYKAASAKKDEKKDAKASAKEEKASAKEEKKASAKEEKTAAKEEKAAAKEEKKDAKAASAKPAASSAKK